MQMWLTSCLRATRLGSMSPLGSSWIEVSSLKNAFFPYRTGNEVNTHTHIFLMNSEWDLKNNYNNKKE